MSSKIGMIYTLLDVFGYVLTGQCSIHNWHLLNHTDFAGVR